MRKHHWFIIAAVIVVVLWLLAEAHRWQSQREIERVYLGDVTVQAIDADTKTPITITFHGPSTGTDQRWPKAFTMTRSANCSQFSSRPRRTSEGRLCNCTTVCSRLKLRHILYRQFASFVYFHNLLEVWRCRGNATKNPLDKR